MSSFTNDARRTGIDKRRKGIGNKGCYRCCDPDDFLAMVHASKTNQEAADNLFVLLNMLPPHAQVWMLYSLIHEQSAVSDVQLLTIYSKAISTLSDSSEQVAHIKIKQHSTVEGNLGYYRFHAIVDGEDLGCLRFHNKPAGTLFLMYSVHRVQSKGAFLERMDLIQNQNAFVEYHRALYGVKGGNPTAVYEGLFTDPQTKTQGALRYLYSDINQTLTNLFSYHASSAPFEVHRTGHLSASIGQIDVPPEVVSICPIL